jgi:hypothetical protein
MTKFSLSLFLQLKKNQEYELFFIDSFALLSLKHKYKERLRKNCKTNSRFSILLMLNNTNILTIDVHEKYIYFHACLFLYFREFLSSVDLIAFNW